MSRAVHYDLSVDDPQRAVDFYRHVFGWKIEKWGGPTDYWLMTTGDETRPGISGGIARRVEPNDSTAIVYDVASVDEAAARVVACGGSIRESKQALRGVGHLVACRDTEGNTFCLLQPDPSVR
jgi:predicted enzyme related to lactoylglutathione lyase